MPACADGQHYEPRDDIPRLPQLRERFRAMRGNLGEDEAARVARRTLQQRIIHATNLMNEAGTGNG